ncbi:MAG: CHAP domain-containing protein [Ruminococcus sp.]|nr:CHAP domain-containing protein [Ruminococcus sp.]
MTVQEILSLARRQTGTYATDVKRCKYNTWYYGYEASGSGYDWCAVFISWLFAQLGQLSLIGGKNANCGYLAKQFESMGRLIKPSSPESGLSLSQLKAGDVVFFHWGRERSTLLPGTYVSDHVGIIESVGGGSVTTIEGNTGGSYNGAVLRQTRYLSQISCVGRPAYSGSSDDGDTGDTPVMTYRVRTGGRWLPEVRDLSDFAGISGQAMTDVALKAEKGRVRYRVHIKGGGWLPYVTGYDISESENGYAGDLKPIDAVEIYYYTPSDVASESGYLRAKYRVSPVGGGYYDWQYDDETSGGQDGYAGDFGDNLDRLQLTLSR